MTLMKPSDSIKKLIEGVPNNHCRGFKTRQAATAFYYEQKSNGSVAIIRTSRCGEVYGGLVSVV